MYISVSVHQPVLLLAAYLNDYLPLFSSLTDIILHKQIKMLIIDAQITSLTCDLNCRASFVLVKMSPRQLALNGC